VKVIAWIAEDTWPACVDAVRDHAPQSAEVVLLHVSGTDAPGAAHGAYAGLLGRGHPERDPSLRIEEMAAASGVQILQAAAEQLGMPCTQLQRTGRIEREVVAAATGAGLLIVARDGDRTRLGPKSLSPISRFIVDHAPCPVLLIWPETAPPAASIPPPPRPGRP
jgi:nucleotide-binding universal stress UspA family protein